MHSTPDDTFSLHADHPLRILQICAPTSVGGLESVVMGISRGLVDRGHQVTVAAAVSPGHDSGPFLGQMERAGVRTVALEHPSRAYHREWRDVAKLLDESRPHVLHTHGYRSDILHGASARRRGIATVTTLHGYMIQGGLSRLGGWLQKFALRRFDGVIAVSRPIMREMEAGVVHPERIHYVQNAWSPAGVMLDRAEARRQLGLPQTGRAIAWIGRMVPIKGADIFVRSLESVQSTDWTACLIGDGPGRSDLEQGVKASGLSDRVVFAGVVHEAARYLSAFDVLVLSSRYEGTPIVVLEAMGAGVPVVATAVGGVPELLGDGTGGWLVPSEDVVALAASVDLVLSDPTAAQERTRFGRARVEEELSVPEWVRRHEKVYQAALEVSRLRPRTQYPWSPL